MMKIVIVVLLVLVSNGSTQMNVQQNITSMKTEIYYFDNYYIKRILEGESLTIVAAIDGTTKLRSDIASSLNKLFVKAYKELDILRDMVEPTYAKGCVNGIEPILSNALTEGVNEFLDCTDDVISKQKILLSSLKKMNSTYLNSVTSTLSKIDNCVKTYPNHESTQRLISCVFAVRESFFRSAWNIRFQLYPESPSMRHFESSVVKCASDIAATLSKKAMEFREQLIECARLSRDIIIEHYTEQLGEWSVFNSTLVQQIRSSQAKYTGLVGSVETEMMTYYDLQKYATNTYIFVSRSRGFYQKVLYGILSDTVRTISTTEGDNPGDAQCAVAARAKLGAVVEKESLACVECDVAITNNTIQYIENINKHFFYINSLLPRAGNAAILSCFQDNYIFASDTIEECSNLAITKLTVEGFKAREKVLKNMNVLWDYKKQFYDSVRPLPCGNITVLTAKWGASEVIYSLKRCIYAASGTDYAVTTPS